MNKQISVIREALEAIRANSTDFDSGLSAHNALKILTQLEAMVGAQEPVAWQILNGVCHAGIRSSEALAKEAAAGMQKTHDLGGSLAAFHVRPLYAAPPAQQYEAGDMASAHNDGFRAGVASVAQQPQEPEMTPAFRSSNAYTVGFQDGKAQALAQQPQAEPTDSMGIPLSCGKPLCSPGDHHPLCRLHKQPQAEAVPEMHDALCPALTGGDCTCTHPTTIDRAWAQFCGGIGRGPDAPYPGMIEAFEAHYGQVFTDKDWREETGVWAAAWKAAKAHGEAAPQQAEAVPPGFVLVPVEPTEAMHRAAVKTIQRCTGNADFPPAVWRAMIAAAQGAKT